MTQPVDKSGLRREARKRRRALGSAMRERAQQAIADALSSRFDSASARRIAAYAAVASEVDLSRWFDRIGRRIELSLPAIDGAAGTMCLRRWQPGDALETGPFAIRQPLPSAAAMDAATLDVVLLPLLGFDRSGTRLGSGAGYYDRALAFRRGRAAPPLLVGIAFAAQEFVQLPRDPWDIPLDAVVTEEGWFDLPQD